MKVAVNTAKLLRNVPLPDEIATVHDNAVVVDMGTGTTRIGFSGDDAPRLQLPTVYGVSPDGTVETFGKAYKRRDTIPIQNVMERGLIKQWDGVEHLLSYIDTLLGISKDPNTPLLLSEAALVPREQREEVVKILFEKHHVAGLYFSSAPVLSLYASGRTSGMAIEMGHGACHTVPVFEGYALFHSILQLDFGGDDLTNWMGKQISKGGHTFPPHHQRDIWQYVKELHCPVASDRSAFTSSVAEANRGDVAFHTLPDGTVVNLGTERYLPCEAFFDPNLILSDKDLAIPVSPGGRRGIHQLALESTRKCDQDVSPLLFSNVVLSGGSSLFRGLPDRIHRELQELAPAEKVRVFASTERKNAAFVGGSILASLPTFQEMWITKGDYDEIGPAVAHRNCF